MSFLVLGTVALDNVKTPSGVKKNMLGGSAALSLCRHYRHDGHLRL